jgi:NADPH2:quinone reductase
MYGTCSAKQSSAVSELGAVPIDYQKQDFVTEIQRLTGDGVDAVFESIGGKHTWQSRTALRRGGVVVAYGLTGSLRRGRLASGRSGGRHRYRAISGYLLYMAAGAILPGHKRVVPYSIQTLMRLKPAMFRQDLMTLFELLQQEKIKPLVARRLPLADARRAHELLGEGAVTGKIVLLPTMPVPAAAPVQAPAETDSAIGVGH